MRGSTSRASAPSIQRSPRPLSLRRSKASRKMRSSSSRIAIEKPGLSIAILDEEERIFREAFDRLKDKGLGLRWIDGADARDVEPRISEECVGGVLYWHGQVDGYRMSVCEAQALERLG